MNTNEFLKKYRRIASSYEYGDGKTHVIMAKRPYCIMNDGFGISIQASEDHYCNPRTNFAPFYAKVELGFPSAEDDLILDWAEDPESPTQTVYSYVPVTVVDKLIKKHGGIDLEATEKRQRLQEELAR